MKVNIENCVNQLCCGDGHDDGRLFATSEMVRHLKELRERTARGDIQALDEFFGLYVFNGDSGFKYRREDKLAAELTQVKAERDGLIKNFIGRKEKSETTVVKHRKTEVWKNGDWVGIEFADVKSGMFFRVFMDGKPVAFIASTDANTTCVSTVPLADLNSLCKWGGGND